MGDGDGGVLFKKHQRQRFSDDVAAADDDGIFAGEVTVDRFEHLHDAVGRAGAKSCDAGHEASGIEFMKAVHVLVRINGFDDAGGVDVMGKRQLHENAVHTLILIEFLNFGEHGGFRGVGGKAHFDIFNPDFRAGAHLVADVDEARGIFADEHHGKSRAMAHLDEFFNAVREIGFDGGGERLSVNESCGQGVLLTYDFHSRHGGLRPQT